MDPGTAGNSDLTTWIVGFAFFLNLAGTIVAIIVSLRRNPPLAEEIYAKFATTEDLDALRKELQGAVTQISLSLKSGDKVFRDMEHMIGRLEGMLARCPYMCVTGGRKPEG